MDPQLEPPSKKPKLATEEPQTSTLPQDMNIVVDQPSVSKPDVTMSSEQPAVQPDKEAEVGITCYLGPESKRFSALLKKRYTDFLVNEILPDGTVLHLHSLKPTKVSRPVEVPEPEAAPTSEPEAPNISQTEPSEVINGAAEANANGTTGGTDKQSTSSPPISDEDKAKIVSHFGEKIASKVIDLHENIAAHPDRRPQHHPTIQSSTAITDRPLRTEIHQDIRRIFHSRIESSTTNDGFMVLSAAAPLTKQQEHRLKSDRRGGPKGRQGKLGWDELGGEHLHFTLYKENKDTMEVMSYLAKEMRMPAKSFQFAGTKDRRGVTVQRACVYRVEAGRMANLNRALRYANIGDFTYEKQGLELGDLGGNEFLITLRDCEWSAPEIQNLPIDEKLTHVKDSVTQSMHDLHSKGFFNYFGLQRFGTFASRTDAVGLKLLQGDFKGACDVILSFNPATLTAAQENDTAAKISHDDKARAEAIHIFQTTGNSNAALDKLPRKFSAESNLIRHLSRQKNDYAGAIMMIPRNLRLMYAHAYQSLVWNFAVGERWRLHGPNVVEGDLVMVSEHTPTTTSTTATPSHTQDEVDEDGEPIIRPAPHDTAGPIDFPRARALTAAEASSSTYSIFDIVLPLPGFDVLYPRENGTEEFYKTFMDDVARGGGLDPHDMRRKHKDFSLSGSYRKILGRIDKDFAVDVKRYREGEDRQFVQTDLDRLKQKDNKDKDKDKEGEDGKVEQGEDEGDKIVIVLKMKLGASQYATMALRELTRGGIAAYKPDFGQGR